MPIRALAATTALIVGAVACGPAGSLSAAVQPSQTPAAGASVVGDLPTLDELVAAASKVWFMADYKIYAANEGQSITSQQRWFYAAPRLRIDVGDSARSSLFVLADAAYACAFVVQRMTCVTVERDDALRTQGGALVQDKLKQSGEQFATTFDGTRLVAGYQSFCYIVRPRGDTRVDFTESRLCYLPNGVPAYQEWKAQGVEARMELVALGKLQEDAFTLPAPPMKFPAPTPTPTPTKR